MKMTKILIQIPVSMKRKLDALRGQGYTTAGFIRAMLVRELNKTTTEPKAR